MLSGAAELDADRIDEDQRLNLMADSATATSAASQPPKESPSQRELFIGQLVEDREIEMNEIVDVYRNPSDAWCCRSRARTAR